VKLEQKKCNKVYIKIKRYFKMTMVELEVYKTLIEGRQ